MELFPTKGPCAADITEFGVIIISTIWCSDFNNLIMIQAIVPFNFEKRHKQSALNSAFSDTILNICLKIKSHFAPFLAYPETGRE